MIELMRERITFQKSEAGTDKNGNHILNWGGLLFLRRLCQ